MPFVEKRLISPTTLTTSASSALYTVPAGYTAIIKQIVVTNTTSSVATFTFYIGTASAGNALFSGTSVAANDTVIINLSQVLSATETLRALASTGTALNLTVSGVENDGPLAQNAVYIPDGSVTVNKIADSSVTSAKITDGSIVNADINASAAIAYTKLASQIVDPKPTSYTVLSSDIGELIVMNNLTNVVTITVDTSTAFPVGQRVDFVGLGTGSVTFVASGVTIYASPGLKLRGQYSGASLICIISGIYVLIGDLSA